MSYTQVLSLLRSVSLSETKVGTFRLKWTHIGKVIDILDLNRQPFAAFLLRGMIANSGA